MEQFFRSKIPESGTNTMPRIFTDLHGLKNNRLKSVLFV